MQMYVDKYPELFEICVDDVGPHKSLALGEMTQDGNHWMEAFFPPITDEEMEINEYFPEQSNVWARRFGITETWKL